MPTGPTRRLDVVIPPDRRVEISISPRTLFLAAAIVALSAALVVIKEALVLVFLGIFLALVFEHPTRLVMRRTRLGRGLAATVVVLGAVLTVVVLALFLLVPLVGDLRDLIKTLPDLVANLRESDELGWLGDSGAAASVQDGSGDLANWIPSGISAILGVAGEAFAAGLAIFTIIFLTLFLVIDMPRLKNALATVTTPETADRTLDLHERITRTVSRWAIGALTIALIAGTVQGTTAYLLGSSFAVALGVIAGLLDLIPNLGATIAGFILVPVLFAEEGLTAALIMLLVILVYQQVENNLLTPTIQGKATDISAFFVILGVTVFGALLGVLGALVAVPIVASLQLVVQEVTKERRARMAAMTGGATTPAPPAPAVE